ncbi:MAG: hypothetical protein ACKOVH_11225 [Actinomycetota bacterium]
MQTGAAIRNAGGLARDLTRRHELDQAWGGPMNGQERRREALAWCIDALGIGVAVETGTHRGTTTAWFAGLGLETHSAEQFWRYHAYARVRFRHEPRVHLVRGDSRAMLRDLVTTTDLDAPTLFYLDAHWAADLPLAEEVAAVVTHWKAPLVVIDDFEVPDDPGYGFDRYGDTVIGFGLLPSLPGFDAYLSAAPAPAETGARRGWVVLAPTATAATCTRCPGLRPAGSR